MTILTSTSSGTYKAQIRSALDKGFKQLYTGTCTESEQAAARNLVRKWFGDAAAETVTQVKNATEIRELIGDFQKDPQRKQVFCVWTFNPAAKPPHKTPLENLADEVDAARAKPESPLAKRARELREARHEPPASEVEIVTAAQDNQAALASIATAIQSHIDVITGHEGAFEEATLEHRLEIGLHIAKAQEIFTVKNDQRQGIGGRPSETLSTVDTVSESPPVGHGFVTWLAQSIPLLKRPTAYRYATAYRALDLPLTAKPAEIRAKLKTLRHQAGKQNLPMPTLAALVKAAPKPPKPESLIIAIPKTSKELKLQDAREIFHGWMATFDLALKRGHLDALDKKGLEQLADFTATVRDRIKARLK
jgi:hypothetical protein